MKRGMDVIASKEYGNGRKGWKRWRRIGMLAGALLLASGAVILAKVIISGNFSGDTVNYKATGVNPNASFTVSLIHVETGQGDQYDEQSNGSGKIEGSGTTGDHIEDGDHVTIILLDAEGTELARCTIQKGKQNGVPWWAYTGLGTVAYFLKKLL